MADEVLTSRDGAVLTITLNRPEVFNAFNAALHAALAEALAAAADPAVRAVVVTGAGRGFSAGQDLREFQQLEGSIRDRLEASYHPNIRAIRALEKPVLAAINGPVAGAGLSLACACDIRVASDAATFVPGFIGIGLVPDSGGSWFIHRILGARAFEWMTSNRRLSAQEALDWGVVSEVVPAEEFPAADRRDCCRVGRAPDARDRPHQAPLRAGLDDQPGRAARARGRAAAAGHRDGGLQGGRHGVPGEAAAALHRRLMRLRTVDYHTGGEPFRIVVDGAELPQGRTILERRRDAAERLDHVRRLLVYEPRGHADMYGCHVVPPKTGTPTSASSSSTTPATRRRAGTGRLRSSPGRSTRASSSARRARTASSSTSLRAASRPGRRSRTVASAPSASAMCRRSSGRPASGPPAAMSTRLRRRVLRLARRAGRAGRAATADRAGTGAEGGARGRA